MFTMLFSGGMIPSYIVVTRLGLANKLPALFLPMACSAYNLIITKNFMTSLPVSLEESARIDGASDITIFFKIVFPLSKPIMAVMALFYGVGIYNDYFNSVLYISSRELYPLQMLLREMIVANTMQSSMIGLGNLTNKSEIFKMATVVISIVPILCVLPVPAKVLCKRVDAGSGERINFNRIRRQHDGKQKKMVSSTRRAGLNASLGVIRLYGGVKFLGSESPEYRSRLWEFQ